MGRQGLKGQEQRLLLGYGAPQEADGKSVQEEHAGWDYDDRGQEEGYGCGQGILSEEEEHGERGVGDVELDSLIDGVKERVVCDGFCTLGCDYEHKHLKEE